MTNRQRATMLRNSQTATNPWLVLKIEKSRLFAGTFLYHFIFSERLIIVLNFLCSRLNLSSSCDKSVIDFSKSFKLSALFVDIGSCQFSRSAFSLIAWQIVTNSSSVQSAIFWNILSINFDSGKINYRANIHRALGVVLYINAHKCVAAFIIQPYPLITPTTFIFTVWYSVVFFSGPGKFRLKHRRTVAHVSIV